jgi:hypothetical protein
MSEQGWGEALLDSGLGEFILELLFELPLYLLESLL